MGSGGGVERLLGGGGVLEGDFSSTEIEQVLLKMWKYYDMKNWSESCKEKTIMTRYDLKHH